MSLTDPCPWIVAEIDDLQDTVKDLEVELIDSQEEADRYHSLCNKWRDKHRDLEHTMRQKIADSNMNGALWSRVW